MAGTVAVRDFKTAEEMKAHYAALQRRCFEAPAVVQRAPEPAPVVKDAQVREPEPEPDHWREFVLRSKETYGLVKVRSLEQREGEATLSGADALRIVSEVTGYTEAQLRGQSRLKGVVRARHIAYWMLVNFAGKSFKGAGRMLGDRDHSTVISGSSRADAALMAIEPPLPETPVGVAQLLWVIKWPRLALVNGRIPRISRPRCACCGAPFEAP